MNTDCSAEGSYLLINEWPVYAFDAFPMMVVLAISGMWYVGKIDHRGKHHKLVPGIEDEVHYLRPQSRQHQV